VTTVKKIVNYQGNTAIRNTIIMHCSARYAKLRVKKKHNNIPNDKQCSIQLLLIFFLLQVLRENIIS